MIFTGSGVAIITPFTDAGNIDYKALDKLIDFQLSNNTDAIIVIGTTGEASTMTEEEKLETIQFVLDKIDGRIPVIAGTGSNNTKATVEFSEKVSLMGVDGLLVVTPYYNKANSKGLVEHYKAVARASHVPIILYNVPGRTGMSIAVDVVEELAQIENIVALKDAVGDLSYTLAVKRVVPEDFAIYSGNDDLILPILAAGGQGVISVVANICPLETHEICRSFFEGDIDRARDLQLELFPLIKSLFVEPNPIPVKAAANIMELSGAKLRLPLYEAEYSTKELLRNNLLKLGKLV